MLHDCFKCIVSSLLNFERSEEIYWFVYACTQSYVIITMPGCGAYYNVKMNPRVICRYIYIGIYSHGRKLGGQSD